MDKLPGSCIFLVVLFSIAASLSTAISPLVCAVFAWIAFLMLLHRLPGPMKLQISVLMLIGVACLAFGWQPGLSLPLSNIFSANHQLIAVIAAVSFLRLIAMPGTESTEPLPHGRGAVLKTFWGLHFFSAVIAISAMMIFGNRIERDGPINRLHGIMFSRSFACCCFWSPFYVAIATALFYAPGSELQFLAVGGIPLAIFGMTISSWQLLKDNDVALTAGYPVHKEALAIPMSLTVLMIICHKLFPGVPILTLIAILSLLLTAVVMLYRSAGAAAALYGAHIVQELPRINRELSLFLAAGVMSTGIGVLIRNTEFALPLDVFTPALATLCIVVSILVSLLGVHPIITISVLGSMLPEHFNPNLLGICMMMMWGLAIVASPWSGINLSIQGRFGIPTLSLMRWNLPYVGFMLLFSSALLHLYAGLITVP